jgi:hypothetical protein
MRLPSPPDHRQVPCTKMIECTSDSHHAVDLAVAKTFESHPLDLKREPGRDRPPLEGDPMSFTQSDLIARGYGLRPNPAAAPAGYAAWLLAASLPARSLEPKRMHHPNAAPNVVQGNGWAGSVLLGAPSYVVVQSFMNVPTVIPGGNGIPFAETVFWNGLGGHGIASGLIQSGFIVTTNTATASISTFHEYCCNDPNGTDTDATGLNASDTLFVQSWYCDKDGTADIAGAFGCTFVHDLTSGALLDCSSENSPCHAALGLVLCSVNNVPNCMTPGLSAEFIAEQTSDQHGSPAAFVDFRPTVIMSGFATSTGGLGTARNSIENVDTDPVSFVLTDWTNANTRLDVQAGPTPWDTCFGSVPRNQFPQDLPNLCCPPNSECATGPLPANGTPISRIRSEQLAAVILYGIIQDAGGVAVVGGSIVRVPPHGPISETLASLPSELSERIAPLLKELPNTAIGLNALSVQLAKTVVSYRSTRMSQTAPP